MEGVGKAKLKELHAKGVSHQTALRRRSSIVFLRFMFCFSILIAIPFVLPTCPKPVVCEPQRKRLWLEAGPQKRESLPSWFFFSNQTSFFVSGETGGARRGRPRKLTRALGRVA
jgi:hypothetical protein